MRQRKKRTPQCPSLLSSNGTCSLVQTECHGWMGLSKPEPCLSVMLPLKPQACGCCSQSDKTVHAISSCTYLLLSTPFLIWSYFPADRAREKIHAPQCAADQRAQRKGRIRETGKKDCWSIKLEATTRIMQSQSDLQRCSSKSPLIAMLISSLGFLYIG